MCVGCVSIRNTRLNRSFERQQAKQHQSSPSSRAGVALVVGLAPTAPLQRLRNFGVWRPSRLLCFLSTH